MSSLAARMHAVHDSPTSGTSHRAKRLREAGIDVVNFAAGELDLATPGPIVEAAREAAGRSEYHHYSPAAGITALREAVAESVSRTGADRTAHDVLICGGTKHAVYSAIQALVDVGDEVLLPTPFWPSYPTMIELSGGRTVPVASTIDDGFRVTVEQLDAAWTPATKLLVFVNPSNPSGAVYPPDEVRAIARWALDRGVWILSDDIYEHLVYPPYPYATIPDVAPEATSCLVQAGGVGKAFAMTGWRIGWLVGPAEIVKAAAAYQSHTTGHVSNIAQAAALAALTTCRDAPAEFRRVLDRRRRRMTELLGEIDGIRVLEPRGAFYVFPEVSGLFGRTLAGQPVRTSLELSELLITHSHVATVPGEAFGQPGHLRLSYALDDATLESGITRIAELVRRAQ